MSGGVGLSGEGLGGEGVGVGGADADEVGEVGGGGAGEEGVWGVILGVEGFVAGEGVVIGGGVVDVAVGVDKGRHEVTYYSQVWTPPWWEQVPRLLWL